MGFRMPGSGGNRSPWYVELRLIDQEEFRCPSLDFPGQARYRTRGTAALDGFLPVEVGEERPRVSAAMRTCVMAWGPGIPEGQAKGVQQLLTWSDQAQEPNPWSKTGVSLNVHGRGGEFSLVHGYNRTCPILICTWQDQLSKN